MYDNEAFLKTLEAAFKKYLQTGARSNEKLKILHSAIASDLAQRLDDPSCDVFSLGIGNGREEKIAGRYVDKKVDIVISRNGRPIAWVAIKFVMSNYLQNSNNYFENMLG